MVPDSRTSDTGDGSVTMACRAALVIVLAAVCVLTVTTTVMVMVTTTGEKSLHAPCANTTSGRVAVVELILRGIERDEVAAAVDLIVEGTLSPGVEDPLRLDDYWAAVVQGRERGGEVFVALMDTQVVAMCQVVIFRHFQRTAGLCAELESVYVRGDLRGRGVGARLIAHAEAFARERGCYRLQLTSRNERHDAHRFYERNGFAPVSQGFKKSLVE